MKCKLTQEADGRPACTVIEHEQAHLLVEMGIAEPDDDECSKRKAMFHAATEESRKRSALVHEQRLKDRRAKSEAALKSRQRELAEEMGVETAEDHHAASAEKR